MSEPKQRPQVEIVDERAARYAAAAAPSEKAPVAWGLVLLLVVAVAAVMIGLEVADDGEPASAPEAATLDQAVDDTVGAGADVDSSRSAFAVDGPTAALLAAELFVAEPGRATAAALLASIGGFEDLVVGTAIGEFDVVTFDPADPSHLLASRRASYGAAENQAANEEWFVGTEQVTQALFDPVLAHDVAHFTAEGEVAVWVNSGNTGGFASRDVTVRGGDNSSTLGPIYASRSVIAANTLFALTGSDDYYAAERRFQALIADRHGRQLVLASGAPWSWVDSPAAGLVVAYPADDSAVTRVWDAITLAEQPTHPLAGQAFQRADVSDDGRVAVAVSATGQLVPIDLANRTMAQPFGAVDATGIDSPITLNEDGTVAVTIDFDGTVTLWWVGDGQPLSVLGGDAGPARVVPEHRAPRASSAVEPSARRVAVRQQASAETGRTRWQILDTDIVSWVARACEIAGRSLTERERVALGLGAAPGACGRRDRGRPRVSRRERRR